MRKILKIFGLLGLTLLLLLGVAVLVLYRLIQVGELRRFLVAEFERRTQLKVQVGETELELGWIVGISFRDVALLGPKDDPLLSAERMLVRIAVVPLMERKVVVSEARFQRPVLRFERDREGKIHNWEFLASLLLGEVKQARFAFDLREIRFEQGEAILRDHPARIVYLRGADLRLRRAGASALELDVKGRVEREGRSAGVALRGRVGLPADGFALRAASLDIDVDVSAMPADLFWDYYGSLLPVRSVGGTFTARVRAQGSPARQLRLRGTADFKALSVGADLFEGEVAPGDGHLGFEGEYSPAELRVSRLDLSAAHLAVQASGRFPRDGEPYLDLRFKTPFLPFRLARQYMPRGLLQPLGPWFLAVNQGEIRLNELGLVGYLSQIGRRSELARENRLWFDADLRGLGADFPGRPYLPVRDLGGKLRLENGVLYYSGKGSYGGLRFSDIEARQRGLFEGRSVLDLRVDGEGDLGLLREQLRLHLLGGQAAQLISELRELRGPASFRAALRTDFKSLYEYSGQLRFEKARLRFEDFPVSDAKGELFFSPVELRAPSVSARLAGSPIALKLLVKNYSEKNGTFDLALDLSGVKAGVLTRLLLSSGSPEDPGTASGWVRYEGSLASPADRKLSGSLELSGVQVPRELFSLPLRDVYGKISFGPAGVGFEKLRGRLLSYGLEVTGKLDHGEKPRLTFVLSSPEMDLGRVFSQMSGGAGADMRGRVSIARGRYEGFEFSDLRTDLTVEKGEWNLSNFFARSSGGTVQGRATFAAGPEGFGFSLEPKVEAVPVKGFFRWFDIETTGLTGNVNLTGTFDSSGKTRADRRANLSGEFHLRIEDGLFQRFRVLVQILNLMDLTRWFTLRLPDINREGIRFRKITGDFKISRGIYTTSNLVVNSDDLRITGAGKIDGGKGEVDFVVAVRPFPTLETAVSFLPLIGPGLAAIKNALLVASFRIQGPIENPTVTPAPLSTLSEFFYGALAIPKNIIGLPGEQSR